MQFANFVQRTLRRTQPAPRGLRPPPTLAGGLPLAGHTIEFIRNSIELLSRAQRELGEVAAFQVAHRRFVALFGPRAHEAFFRAPDEQLSPSEPYKIMVPVFGKDIVYDAEPARMGEQLKMLLPALKDRRMRTYGEIIVEEVERSVVDWGDEGEIDIVDYCRVLTNFTSSHCLLGKEFREEMTAEFAQVYHDLERGVTPLAYINAHLPLPSFRRRDRARVRLVEMITDIVARRRATDRQGEDFLQTLMDAEYRSGARLSEHEITGMLLAAMFAGHHTSSVTTAWALLELLQHPIELARVTAQLEQVYGAEAAVTYQSLRQVTSTERVVKETLRLHPPLFVLLRIARRDFEYGGFHIPRGSFVAVSPHVAHRIPSIFRDPHRFDPERYALPREEDKVPFAYIPFGGGRHKCLGNAFALLQVKAILAVLLRRYDFELIGDPLGSDFHGLVVGPAQPCRLLYRRRGRRAQIHVPAGRGQVVRAESPAAGADALAASVLDGESSAVPQGVGVEIDSDLCQGHGVCVGEAAELFAVGDDDKARLLLPPRTAAELESLRKAARYCPTGAIKVVVADQRPAN